MFELIARLVTALALQGQPLCAPDPVPQWTTPPDVVGERECTALPDHEYRCSAEGGTILLHRWYADVNGDQYKVEIRERVFVHDRDFAGQRVYRNGTRLNDAPLYSLFAGEKMQRVRPEPCDLPSVTLTDA